MALQICQSRFKFCQTLNQPLKKLTNTFNSLQKWQNFAKSGYIEGGRVDNAFNIKRTLKLTFTFKILDSFQRAF